MTFAGRCRTLLTSCGLPFSRIEIVNVRLGSKWQLVVGSDRQLYLFNHYSEAILTMHLVRERLADR
jgi:hypothetical protein